jgi:4-hydroxy-3-polyprenylbenzoate decarboxylase
MFVLLFVTIVLASVVVLCKQGIFEGPFLARLWRASSSDTQVYHKPMPAEARDDIASTSTQRTSRKKRIVVAMTGALGAILAIELLQQLRRLDVETHLIISKWAVETLKYETDMKVADIRALASFTYNVNDVSAPPSSGSFQTDGMIIIPCTVKTLSAIRVGYGEGLIARSADVMIKEQRKLVLCVRETPLSPIHLENMLALARIGVCIFPSVSASYIKPQSVQDIVVQSVGRMLDALGLDSNAFPRWNGME